ncbi:hypothetical protein ACWIDJ_16805, partial [Brevundimonas naejangsanensis]
MGVFKIPPLAFEIGNLPIILEQISPALVIQTGHFSGRHLRNPGLHLRRSVAAADIGHRNARGTMNAGGEINLDVKNADRARWQSERNLLQASLFHDGQDVLVN